MHIHNERCGAVFFVEVGRSGVKLMFLERRTAAGRGRVVTPTASSSHDVLSTVSSESAVQCTPALCKDLGLLNSIRQLNFLICCFVKQEDYPLSDNRILLACQCN